MSSRSLMTSRRLVLSSLSMLLLLDSGCHGLSAGAPLGACVNLRPGHPGNPQQSQSPYQLNVSPTNIQPGESVSVTLSGDEPQFKGFLIQARSAEGPMSSYPLGQFVTIDGNSQTINCCGQTNSAITHNNNTYKAKVTATWQAPANLNMDVVFVATVVQNFNTYWVRQQSNNVTLNATP